MLPTLRAFRRRSPAAILAIGIGAMASAQHVTWMEGPVIDQLCVRSWHAGAPNAAPTTVLPLVAVREPFLLGRTANQHAELTQTRQVTRGGLPRIELPGGLRLFVYERRDQPGHGLLTIAASGEARVVHESPESLDIPLAVATDHRHVAYVRDQALVVVKIDGGTFGNGSRTIVSNLPPNVEPESLVVGPTHAFVVAEAQAIGGSDRLLRVPFGGAPVDVAPFAAVASSIEPTLAIAGNGALVAFLREIAGEEHDVWVVGADGASRRIPLPQREYRQSTWIPFGAGSTHLLLNGDGSRLLVTEVRTEDELLLVDTAIGGNAMHVTGDAMFSTYIGSHILPCFAGDRLVVASGHVGWRDWYSLQLDGSALNLTATGSPEPPFLVGALDVQARFALANGTSLGTDAVGTAMRLRRLDPAGGAQTLFVDLVEPPWVGAAVAGAPDLRIVGVGGQRLVSGDDGAVLLAAPVGIELTDPVRSPAGWRASFARLSTGPGVLVLQLPDGSLLVGDASFAPPQLAAFAGGELAALWPSRWDVWTASGRQSLPLAPAAIRVALSGVGG